MKLPVRYFKRPFAGTITLWVYYMYESGNWYKMYEHGSCWVLIDTLINKDLIDVSEEEVRTIEKANKIL